MNYLSVFKVSILLCVLLLFMSSTEAQCIPKGMVLLNGYTCSRDANLGVATTSGFISRKDGLRIEFEEGISQGYWANPENRTQFVWFKEQKLDRSKVWVALRENPPIGPKNESKTRDRTLIVTFPLGNQKHHAINFRVHIVSDEELAEALLMILTYRP